MAESRSTEFLVPTNNYDEDSQTAPQRIKKSIIPCLAELWGTCLFVFIGSMGIATSVVAGGNIVGVAAAHGFTIGLLVASFGAISGGHFNPAVTLGATLAGGLHVIIAPLYVLSQLIGSIIGSALCRGVLSFSISNSTTNQTVFEQISAGGQQLHPDVSVGEGVLCEMTLTIVLVTAVLMTAVDTDGKNAVHPIAIGLAVFVDILAGGFATGASMNPARSFGPAVVGSDLHVGLWDNHWVYWVGPGLGSIVASITYRLLFGRPDKRLLLKND